MNDQEEQEKKPKEEKNRTEEEKKKEAAKKEEEKKQAEARIARMAALSDGVFGVALTLLLLEIRPKNVEFATDDWWNQVFLNSGLFAASFMLVGIYWVAHKNESVYLKEGDRFLDWINLVFLATVALLPFSVSVLSESWHSGVHLPRAVGLYLGNVTGAGVALSIFFGYCSAHRGWLTEKGLEKRRLTVVKNALLPLLCATAWICFVLNPAFVEDNFWLFMAFPPASYLGLTLFVALFKKIWRWWFKRT